MIRMEEKEVKNIELLALLNQIKSFLTRDIEKFKEMMHSHGEEQKNNRNWWVGEEYLKEIVSQDRDHEGFPDALYGYECSTHREKHEFFKRNANPLQRKEMNEELCRIQSELTQWLGVKHNALTAYYPPGGFISWHNNANAAAYNLIFTWAERPLKGWFKYLDPDTKEIVTMVDNKGWQLKAGYFGSYDEPENLLYHCASTDCWRITVSFTFDTSELSEEYRQELLEEIASEL